MTVAWVQSLAQEFPHAAGAVEKKSNSYHVIMLIHLFMWLYIIWYIQSLKKRVFRLFLIPCYCEEGYNASLPVSTHKGGILSYICLEVAVTPRDSQVLIQWDACPIPLPKLSSDKKKLTVWPSCLKPSSGYSFTSKCIAQSSGSNKGPSLPGFCPPPPLDSGPTELLSVFQLFRTIFLGGTPWFLISLHLHVLRPMFWKPVPL